MRTRCLRQGSLTLSSVLYAPLSRGSSASSGFWTLPPDFLAPALHQSPPRPNGSRKTGRTYVLQTTKKPSATAVAIEKPLSASSSEESPSSKESASVANVRRRAHEVQPVARHPLQKAIHYYPEYDDLDSILQLPQSRLPAALRKIESETALTQPFLSHLALVKGQWDEFLRLVKLLAAENKHLQQSPNPETPKGLQHASLWQNLGTMQSMTRYPINLQPPDQIAAVATSSRETPSIALDYTKEVAFEDFEETRKAKDLDGMGIVWESLGHLVMEATSAHQQSTSSFVMSYVHEALAYLHSEGAISPLLYDHDDDDVPASLRKPPLLSILQPWILDSLTDAAWKAKRREGNDETTPKQSSSTQPRMWNMMPEDWYKPDENPLRPEVWMELVLWSCVHGGHYDVASRLLQKMSIDEKPWKATSWRDLGTPTTDQSSQSSNWLLLLAGIIGGQDSGSTDVKVPERTVSREVVVSVFDSLLNDFQTSTPRVSGSRLFVSFQHCEMLGAISQTTEDACYWNSAVAKILHAGSFDLRTDRSLLHLAFRMSQRLLQAEASRPNSQNRDLPWLFDIATNDTTLMTGVLDWCINGHFLANNTRGAMQLAARWRPTADSAYRTSLANKYQPTQNSATSRDGTEVVSGTDSTQSETQEIIPRAGILIPMLPTLSLAVLLERMANLPGHLSKDNMRRVRALVGLHDEASPIWQNSSFWPALLRFATSISDVKLLDQLYDRINSPAAPLQTETLVALLHCQIAYREWERVRSLFAALANTPGFAVEALDIALVARQIMLAEADGARDDGHDRRARATDASVDEPALHDGAQLLKSLLEGAYSPPDWHLGRHRDTRPRVRRQLGRVLAHTFGRCRDVGRAVTRNRPARLGHIILPTEAFNTLLEAVVSVEGVVRGHWMLQRWCFPPDQWPQSSDEARQGTGPALQSAIERAAVQRHYVALPDLQTVQAVLAPAEQELRLWLRSEEGQAAISRQDGVEPSSAKSQESPADVEAHFPWRALDAGEEVDLLAYRLPPEAPHRQLIEQCWRMYLRLTRTSRHAGDNLPSKDEEDASMRLETTMQILDRPSAESMEEPTIKWDR